MLEQGLLGDLVMGRAQLSCWYPDMPGAWRQDPALGGGGALIEIAWARVVYESRTIAGEVVVPFFTEGYEGFVHPVDIDAGVEKTTVKFIVRDFDEAGLVQKEQLLEKLACKAVLEFPGASVNSIVEESYRNMKDVLDRYPEVRDSAIEAIRRAGLEPRVEPIRGVTDGTKLSFMGLPTPNIFAGEHNFHSRYEWISTYDMHKAVEVIIELCQVWEEKTG